MEPGDSPADTARHGAPCEMILVVDDEEDVRSYSAGVLRELGYKVLEAAGGEAAREVLQNEDQIALLFTDVGLPGGMNGRQLADEARTLRPGLKVLLTSGYAADALVRGGRLESGLQLLSKPFTYSGLAAKVRDILDSGRRPLHVLIVEDEPLVRVTIVEALLDAGCRIEEAATASEGLARFRELDGEVDAAIIDIGLPDGRGDGLIAAFRSQRPEIAILLATGYDDAMAKDEFATDDRVAVLEKPFDGPKLRAALRDIGVGIAP
jgi:CheY-like chemotaxis protein